MVDDPGPRHQVTRTRNVPFARVGGRVLKLDVFAPSEPAPDGARRPALLQIHGGAWVIGDKREQGIPLLKAVARDGWVGFNANYRLSPAATWPDHLVDIKRALAFIREHADEYGVDPDFVAVTGGSAGGHLATMVALTQNEARYQPGFEDADTSVQACVPFYGVYDFTNRAGTMPPQFRDWFLQPLIMKAFYDDEPERFRDASPLDNLRPDVPPFLVVHGDNDTLAPVADARTFVAALREVSTSSVHFLELRGAQHSFDVFTSVRTRRVVRAVERFLGVQWRAHLHREPGDRPDPTSTPGPATRRPAPLVDRVGGSGPAGASSPRTVTGDHHVGWCAAREFLCHVSSVVVTAPSSRPAVPRGAMVKPRAEKPSGATQHERRTPMTELAIGTAVDLTEATERARALVLAHTDAPFRQLADHLPIGVFLLDTTGGSST